MMTFEILDQKEIIDGKTDMLSNIVIIDYDNIPIVDWILVDEFSAMGLDYIAERILGDSGYTWVLMKFNRIDSPLEINIGDIIAIPDINEFRKHTKMVNYNSITTSMMKKQREAYRKIATNAATKVSPGSNFVKQSGNVIL